MKKKTAVEQTIEFFIDEVGCTLSAEQVEVLVQFIDVEKFQIVDAWIDGNREGWEQNTDWPEDGIVYYNKNYSNIEKTETSGLKRNRFGFKR